MELFKSYRPASLLGLALEGRQLEGVILQQSNGTLRMARTFRTSLTLDPLTSDPALVGREIRNHLDEAGIRERRCTVCIPLQWAMTLHSKVPELPEADVQNFLNLEAERGFPNAPETLSIAVSRYRTASGEQHALSVAIPKGHLTLLEQALVAARLRPLSFSLGITALQAAQDEPTAGLLTLAIGETCVELQVTSHGGVAALRTLEGVFESESAEKTIDADLIAREIRITLGQLPKELRDTVNHIRVFGRTEVATPLVNAIAPVARSMGLLVELGTPLRADGLAAGSSQGNADAALGLAARHLAGVPAGFEFLPPKESAWTRITGRFSSRKIAYVGAAAGTALALFIGAFLWQYWRLSLLESRWRAIQSRVNDVKALQQNIQKYRGWYDESVLGLRIMRRITEAFPEDGSASAKALQIKDLSEVSCSGQARDNLAWLKLLDQLKEAPQITKLKVQQVSGKAPVQFNLTFLWVDGARHEN